MWEWGAIRDERIAEDVEGNGALWAGGADAEVEEDACILEDWRVGGDAKTASPS